MLKYIYIAKVRLKNGKEKIRIKKFNSSQSFEDLVNIHYLKVVVLDIDLEIKQMYQRHKPTKTNSLFDERIYIAGWV